MIATKSSPSTSNPTLLDNSHLLVSRERDDYLKHWTSKSRNWRYYYGRRKRYALVAQISGLIHSVNLKEEENDAGGMVIPLVKLSLPSNGNILINENYGCEWLWTIACHQQKLTTSCPSLMEGKKLYNTRRIPPTPIVATAITKKMMKFFLPKLPSFWHIIIKNGHFNA
jgi:hypothetical protein